MPKIGPHQIPNHDIETVVDLIDEAYARVQVSEGPLDEETFREEVLQRRGGSYSRYRFDLQLYGFIKRSHGADEVEITSRFLDVADPVPRSARDGAITEAVRSIEMFLELHASGFTPGFSDRDLRVWLIQDLNVPRDEAKEDAVQELREIYEPAYQYLDESGNERGDADGDQNMDESGDQEDVDLPDEGSEEAKSQPPIPQNTDSKDMETIQIGNKYVSLPKENIAEEWRMLKATVDAYINSLEDGGQEDE